MARRELVRTAGVWAEFPAATVVMYGIAIAILGARRALVAVARPETCDGMC